MAEAKYEQPLEYYTVDNFIKESRKLVGKPVYGIYADPLNEVAYLSAQRNFAANMGNDNPIYTDLEYALASRWETTIAPPTFLVTVRFPISHGALYDGPYPLVGMEAGFAWEWFDVVRMNDKLTGDLILTDVYEETNERFQSRVVYLVAEGKYFNKTTKELIATCSGKFAAIARAESVTEIPDAITEGFKKQPIIDREVYHYSEEELERIYQGIEGEVRRGYKPLYWEEVNVGETLTPVVKGVLCLQDLMNYKKAVFSFKNLPVFEAQFRKGLMTPGFLRTNPVTGWPYDIVESEHCDQHLSGGRGLPNMFAHGAFRVDFYTHLLSNWMGDDGFIRRLEADTVEPHIYGDTLWVSGKVIKKYKDRVGDEEYGAVDLELEAVNQLGQNVSPGTATVYLSSPGRDVEVPVPR